MELIRKFNSVSFGTDHTTFVTSDGQVFCCGENYKGKLGVGENKKLKEVKETMKALLVEALEGKSIVHVECGEGHNIAISED